MRDPVRQTAARTPEAPALRAMSDTWSYARLDNEVDRLAQQLVGAGVRSGDRVALLFTGGPEAVLATHAVPRAGATVVPLHPAWPEPELERCIRALAPGGVVVLCTADTEAAARALADRHAVFTLSTPVEGARPLAATARAAPLADSIDLSLTHSVLWTSGTGGRPRGVELTWDNQLASAAAVSDRLALDPADTWYAALALAHVGGICLVVRAAITGSCLIAPGSFNAEDLARRIDTAEVTHVSLVPTMLRWLLDARADRAAPPTLRTVLLGGAPMPAELLDRALDLAYPISVTYGLTEATSQVATATPDLVRRKPGTVGAPLEGVEVRIAQDGEILVRGPTVMRGYVGETTQPLSDGWLHTGDLGRIDGDGHLWVTGRLDERIISGGVTVDPAEVERVLIDHADVREAAVVGLDDREWGEVVAAAIVPVRGRQVVLAALDDHCRAALAPAKRPRWLAVVGDLPRNANGKVDRHAVRALLLRSRR